MRIGVIGTGHVGLVTGVTLAHLGHHVVATDADKEKVDGLRNGTTPFYEPGLSELLRSTLESGRLAFTVHTGEAVFGAAVAFICVGTPPRQDGEANLIAIERAAREVAKQSSPGTVLVEKSTVPAGTANRIRRALVMEGRGDAAGLEVASNPEFLREGKAVEDSLHPDRILVGAEAQWVFEVMREVYATLVAHGHPIIETNISTAELAKHACNAFLAMKISYANSLARVCERAGADVVAIADVMGADPRIGRSFLNAGLGYGGSCFPKDIQAFQRLSSRLGYEFRLLGEVARVNTEALETTVEKIREGVWNLEDKRIALLGLSFKPGTDDVRFAPALALAQRLLAEGATVVGYDPQAMPNAKEEVPMLELAPDPYMAADAANCVVVCTEWPEFLDLDLPRLRKRMAYPFLVDGRNLFDPERVREAGLMYLPTGRPAGI